jgi:hypothetical protein
LVVGEPVEFRVLSSTVRKADALGTVLDEYEWPDKLTERAPLVAALPAEGLTAGAVVPVRLEVKVSEVGTVAIGCACSDGPAAGRSSSACASRKRAEPSPG